MAQQQSHLERVRKWVGVPLGRDQTRVLHSYADWLLSEALPSGGIGPDEAPRLWDRHICDSLAFAKAWFDEAAPRSGVDVGSGVGLPGIPLAILWPTSRWTLLDRSGRRADLLRRAVRVLDLANVRVVQGTYEDHSGAYEAVVARGVNTPAVLAERIAHLLTPRGRAVVGLTRQARDVCTAIPDGRVVSIPPKVLDGGGKILIIGPRDR
ncbi:MAG: class I SAM-dependent methyltransferase [Acidimicrobiia bacterium]|nr:class I SAM-dependent methyltransferase [Acidimicrobiia bacterium]